MFFELGVKLLTQFWGYKEILCCKNKKKNTQEINMWYSITN